MPARFSHASQPLLWLVATAFFMQMLDSTIVNTALPAIARSLHENPLQMHNVIIAYTLSVALLMPASGWLADRFGTRRIFMYAVILFTLGSLFCAQSQTLSQLVLSRILQGIGGAMMMPVGRLAVLRAYPKEKFLQAMSFVTIPGLLGPLVGPTLGGWLTQVLSWHWIFLINIPFGFVACYFTFKVMPDFRNEQLKKFDIYGYILLAFSMICVSLSLDGTSGLGGVRTTALLLSIIGSAALFTYWRHAKKSQAALFPLSLFKIHSFSVGIVGNLFARIGNTSMPFLLPLFLQVSLGYTPFHAGLMMIPSAIASILVKSITTQLVRHFGYRKVLSINTFLVGLIIAAFSLLSTSTPLAWIIVHFFMFGAVNSLQFTAMNTVTLKDLDTAHASSGNSLLSMVMQLSMSFGVSIAGALLSIFSGLSSASSANHQAFIISFVCLGLVTMISSVIFMKLHKDGAGIIKD